MKVKNLKEALDRGIISQELFNAMQFYFHENYFYYKKNSLNIAERDIDDEVCELKEPQQAIIPTML